MKKLLHIILFLVIVLGLAACHKPEEISFDPSLLYGKWQEGSVYERYYASAIERVLPNGDTVQVNGTTWDVSDDVTEEEAQLFNWTLTGATLKHEHVGTFVTVPKVYTIIMLGSNYLVYKDDYGVTHHYSKVN
jgi:hypothetical protein